MIAILAPGQGSQKPGMLSSWLELPQIAAQAAELSDATGLDIVRLGTSAAADELQDTAITQPMVVATALLAERAIRSHIALPTDTPVAGHSVGELAAAALAGVIDLPTAVTLAGKRGAAMAECCREAETSMAAVLGGDPETVIAALADRGLVGANVNGGGQIVAAGRLEAITALREDPPGDAARVIPLKVAGAFHTEFMAGAETALAAAIGELQPQDPTRPLLTNADGRVVTSGAEYVQLLVRQLTRPVRWDKCMTTLAQLGVNAVIELPPAGALVGLVKRELPHIPTLAVKKLDDLDKIAAFVAEHTAEHAPSASPSDLTQN